MLMDILMNERLALGGVSNIIWFALLLGTIGGVFFAVLECISGRERGFKRILVQISKMYSIGAGAFPLNAAILVLFSAIGVGSDYWTRENVISFLTGELTRGFISYIIISVLLAVVISIAAHRISRLLYSGEKM